MEDKSFSFQDALLGLTTVVAWADGENQGSEIDTRVKMMFHEKIGEKTLLEFKRKYDRINDDENVFRLSLAALKTAPLHVKANACAWMYKVAVVASNGKEGDLDYIEDRWTGSTENVDQVELELINRARKELDISLDQMIEEYKKLPDINRI